MKVHKWGDIKEAKLGKERVKRIQAEAMVEARALTLRQLREEAGLTQEAMAELTEQTQSALSRIERREDNPVEAVRRYVEALGGQIEIVAVLGNKRVKLLGV